MNGPIPDFRRVLRLPQSLWLVALHGAAQAADAPAFAAPAAAATGGTPGVGRVLVSLILVLALLLGGAWLTRRLSGVSGGTQSRIRLLASVSLGARERAVLIAVDGREVLLGVAPGNVRTLLVGEPPAPDDAGSSGPATLAVPGLRASFGDMLRRSLGK
jgi:flagellar protein FliO/FliZ